MKVRAHAVSHKLKWIRFTTEERNISDNMEKSQTVPAQIYPQTLPQSGLGANHGRMAPQGEI